MRHIKIITQSTVPAPVVGPNILDCLNTFLDTGGSLEQLKSCLDCKAGKC